MRTSDLHDHLREALLDLAWGQWTAMGVAGVRAGGRTIIDPEALTLATLAVGRFDARLFDEMLDWVAVNSRLLDMARLRRLGKRASVEQQRLLGAVAEVAALHAEGSGAKRLGWASVLAEEAPVAYGSEPLFRSDRPGGADWAATDDIFARVGFLRSSPELRGMSRPPDASRPTCLRFRARALVGLGARAEVLTYLWTHEWAHGRLIAERAAYNQAPVAESLADLAAGKLADTRADGRKTLYRLAEGLQALGTPTPDYVDWVRAWPALITLLSALRPDGLSEDAARVRLAEVLASQRDGLETEGLDVEIGDLRGWADRGSEWMADLIDSVVERTHYLGQ